MKRPSVRQLAIGHVERVTVQEDHLFKIEIELYKEPACQVYQIRGFKRVKSSSSCDRLFWESENTLDKAFKLFKTKIKGYSV